MSFTRLFHTVRYLKPLQIYRRVYRPRPVARSPQVAIRKATNSWVPTIPRANFQTGSRAFRFLNQERQIETWNDQGIPKLWLYNLHYFEHVEPELMQDWIQKNPPGHGVGWEPYPLSLRIANWIKSGLPLDAQNLATQAQYLSDSVEYHLLGNHLWANAKALVFSGAYFDHELWLRQGLCILREQIEEQILADGGHFERSLMYHCIILEDLLDLINLSRVYPGLIPDLSAPATQMLSWLRHMTHPDGQISFFNDAAFAIAPEPQKLEAYAGRLNIVPRDGSLRGNEYIRLENDRAVVIFDAAPIGPDYQPGHAHADTLSFELSVDGHRTIVNSGTSTYEPVPDRAFQRGTAAHNTVQIDGEDSSEVWSTFRVGRRAKVVDIDTDHRTFATASHTGYLRLKDPVLHTRTLELRSNSLRISDIVEARGRHCVNIFFHLHPETHVQVHIDKQLTLIEKTSNWFPEFNKPVPNRTIVGQWSGQCPAIFVTEIPFR